MRRGDVAAQNAGLDEGERVVLRRLHRGETVGELGRRLAEHHGAGKLGVEAAGTVVLDEDCEMLARLEGPALQVAVGEARALAERRRGAEKQALLAAEQAALVLRERGDVG